jgi:hypothetical protein
VHQVLFGEKAFPVGVDADGDVFIAAAEYGQVKKAQLYDLVTRQD